MTDKNTDDKDLHTDPNENSAFWRAHVLRIIAAQKFITLIIIGGTAGGIFAGGIGVLIGVLSGVICGIIVIGIVIHFLNKMKDTKSYYAVTEDIRKALEAIYYKR